MKKNKASEVFKIGEHKIGYVSNSFISEFGNEDVFPGTELSFQKLPRNMNDSEIIKELGVQECTLGDILATIDSITDDMKDGWSNIFYVKGHSRVVFVHWVAVLGEWGVDAWLRGDDSWNAGFRVFSPAIDARFRSPGLSGALTFETLAHRIQELEEWKERVQK